MNARAMLRERIQRRKEALEALEKQLADASESELAELMLQGILSAGEPRPVSLATSGPGGGLAVGQHRAKLSRGELDRGVRAAVADIEGEFTWRTVFAWLEDHRIFMSARQPHIVLNEKLRRLVAEGVIRRVVEGGPGRPAVYVRTAESS